MDTIKIGRNATNDLVLSDSTVSRQHAIVTISPDGKAIIRDLNSTQGTYIDGKRITADTEITAASKIRLGNTELTLGQILNAGRSGDRKEVNTSGIQGKLRVGRSHDNDIVISAGDVSSHHCVIGKDSSGTPVIADTGSSNGTFVNGRRISSVTPLHAGDNVRLGNSATLSWEQYLIQAKPRPKQKKNGMLIGIAAAMLLVIAGVVVYKLMNRSAKPMEPVEIYDKYASSVVLIYTEGGYTVTFNGASPSAYDSDLQILDCVHLDEDGDVVSGTQGSFGTGFFISKDGKIMTNRHVILPLGDEEKKTTEKIKGTIENLLNTLAYQTGEMGYAMLADDIDVKYETTYTGVARNDTYVSSINDFLPASLYKASENGDLDVGIIQLNSKRTPDDAVIVDMTDISKPEDRKIGSKVYTIGFPQALTLGTTKVGLEANNQSGEITQERGEYTYGHNITIHQGASGSPVFDTYGRFAGIIVSGFLGLSQGYNHAVNPDKAAQFVNN